MNFVKRSPLNDAECFRNSIGRLFDESFFPAKRSEEPASFRLNPAVDVYENDNSYVISAELPGLDKENISVDLKESVLTIKGERSCGDENKEDRYFCKERGYGKFHRAFTLSRIADSEKISAEYKDGVLKVSIPKIEEVKPRTITIH
ncbi:MAG: Hsp20/alpha crystallin family protein [Desulfobacteraceae bacterium]|nr:Hsp20/alpha crystallin family protein [Desulfobacteraceae bacterium]